MTKKEMVRLFSAVERMTEASVEMACQNPPDNCECHGCMVAAERHSAS